MSYVYMLFVFWRAQIGLKLISVRAWFFCVSSLLFQHAELGPYEGGTQNYPCCKKQREKSQISHGCRKEVPWNSHQPFPGPATSWICKASGQMKGADGMWLFNESGTACFAHSWSGPC